VDKLVRTWGVADRKPLRTLAGHTRHVHAVAFGGDGNRVIAAGETGTILIWGKAGPTPSQTLSAGKHHVNGMVVSPDGGTLVAATGSGLLAWTLPAGTPSGTTFDGAGLARAVAVNADGTRLATTHEDRTVKVWDAATGEMRIEYRGHRDIGTGVAFAPDGRTLATANADGTVKVWPVPAR